MFKRFFGFFEGATSRLTARIAMTSAALTTGLMAVPAQATALQSLMQAQKQAGAATYDAIGTWGMVIGLILAIGGIVQMVTAHKKNEPKTIGLYMFAGGAALVSLGALLSFGAGAVLGNGATLSHTTDTFN
jgi:hypothetical protein